MKATYNISIDFHFTVDMDSKYLYDAIDVAQHICKQCMDRLPIVKGTGFFHIMDATRHIEEEETC